MKPTGQFRWLVKWGNPIPCRQEFWLPENQPDEDEWNSADIDWSLHEGEWRDIPSGDQP